MNSGINLLYVAIVCGIIAVLYGIVTSRQVLSLSPGNQRMIEVSAAIQEGAAARSRRGNAFFTTSDEDDPGRDADRW